MVARRLRNPNSHFQQEGMILRSGGECIGVHRSGDGSHVLRVFKTKEGDVVSFFIEGDAPIHQWIKEGGTQAIDTKLKSFEGSLTAIKISPRPSAERGY
jgi:hypothetical protein